MGRQEMSSRLGQLPEHPADNLEVTAKRFVGCGMQIYRSLAVPITGRPTVVTIGNFDGVHIGHQRLIQTVVEAARTKGIQSALVTFSPHPRSLTSGTGFVTLSSDQEKLERMKRLGLDLVVVVEFTPEFRLIQASQFVEMLVSNLRMTELWIGRDFRFGLDRKGDLGLLREMGSELGFTAHQLDPVTLGGVTVSSSCIRRALQTGNFELAHTYLGQVP